MVLAHMNISVELREILLRDRPQSLSDISPKATVPVLQLKDGNIIDESIDIMLWALKQGKQIWYNDNIEEQNNLIINNDFQFKNWLDRYKYHIRYPEFPREFYRKKCSETVSDYENKLKINKYILGELCCLADVAIFPFIRQFANVDREWFSNKYPNLDNWLINWIESSLFKSIMDKYKQWEPEHTPLIINFT